MYFLDSDTCIYFLNGKYPHLAENVLSLNAKAIKISAIVKAELLMGALKSQFPQRSTTVVEQFLMPFEVMPFGDKETFIYAKIRNELEKRGKIIGPNDLLIAATVLSHGGKLVTHNTREFKRVPGLEIVDWV